jgi:hypothetical protein
MRQVVGMAPHPDPKADQLVNSNMPQGSPTPTGVPSEGTPPEENPGMADLASSFDEIYAAINDALAMSSSNGSESDATS